jgi:hypothetical protein
VTNQSLSIDKGPAGSLCAHNQLLVGQYFSLSSYRVKLKVHTRAHNHLLLVRSTPFTALSFHPSRSCLTFHVQCRRSYQIKVHIYASVAI